MSLLFADIALAQERGHARSMVITQQGIVATSHVLASQAGAQILARGGSAVDAAIAANAVLSVTEPMMCGIGGDFFVLYWDAKTGKADGHERQRVCTEAPDPRVPGVERHLDHAGAGHPLGDRAGCGGWVGEDARPLRQAAMEDPFRRGDSLCGPGRAGTRDDRGQLAAAQLRVLHRREPQGLRSRRKSAGSRRRVPQPGLRARVAAARRAGARRVLSRRDRAGNPDDLRSGSAVPSRPTISPSIPQSGSSRSPPPIAVGASTNCRRTGRGWRRSRS